MKLIKFINKFEKGVLNKTIPQLNVGNKARVGIVIKEGEKKRVQFFEGIIISKNKSSIDTTITIRRIFQGIGIERTFPVYSPQIKSIKIIDETQSKRAKLFYLRNKIGKAAMKIQGR
uniref:Ribosomal protein L19 n=2 Tax=Ostreobium TaxID=121087 RepID=A0A1A8H2N8_9CHLO|nr:Ribosomal protein L19 [Ostreobium quekettii]ANG44391.1 ribosomal protein L19 [Ostreobium sp. OS1B]SBQ77005.1 Ribosomal protein L19 [Ostreobium quekettii]